MSDATAINMMRLDENGRSSGPPTDLFGGYIVSAASNVNTVFMLHGAYSQPTLLSVYRPDGTLVSNAPLSNAANLRPMMSLVLPSGDYAFLANVWDCPGAVPCIVTATLITMSESGTTSTKPLQQISQWTKSAAAFRHGRLLMAWMSDADPLHASRTVSFRVFDAAGNPVTDPKTVALTNQLQSINGYFGATVGFDGQDFLVAWQRPSANEQSGEVPA